MVTLSQEDVKSVFDYLNEQPTKFSVPLMNFINKKIEDQRAAQIQNEKDREFEDGTAQGPYLPEEDPATHLETPDDIPVNSPEIIANDDPIDD